MLRRALRLFALLLMSSAASAQTCPADQEQSVGLRFGDTFASAIAASQEERAFSRRRYAGASAAALGSRIGRLTSAAKTASAMSAYHIQS